MTTPWDRGAWAAGAALLAFAALAAAVALRVTGSFDATLADAVRWTASPSADAVARGFTLLASGPVTIAVVALVALAAALSGARRIAVLAVAAWVASGLGAQLLKALSGRVRPSFPYTIAALPSAAFPSGHAMNAVIVWGFVAIVAGRRWPRARNALIGAAGALAIGAGVSRVYLGVHFATDVLGGWSAGIAILAALAAALPPVRRDAPHAP